MKRILKYYYGEKPVATIEMPNDSKVVRVAFQKSQYGNGMMVWAEVDPAKDLKEHKFVFLKTGEDVPLDAFYLTTLENKDGMIMHLYQFR